MKRAIKIISILSALFLLLIVALSLFARMLITPERIKATVIPRAEAVLNRKVSLDDVKISIFTGIRLNRLTVLEPDGNESFIAAEAVVLRYKLWPLLFKRIIIDEISLIAPAIRVERQAGGQFNFSDLLPGEKPPAESDAEKRGEPADLLVSKIEISSGRLLFIDHQAPGGAPFRQEITELNLAARDISLGSEFPFNFGARLNEGLFKGEGTIDPQTMAGRLALAIDNLDLAAFAPYYREKIPAQINALRLNLKVDVEGSRQGVKSKGEVVLAPVDLLLRREGKNPLPLRNITLSLNYAVNADLAAAALAIETATLAFNRIPLQVDGRVTDFATAPKVNLRLVVPELALEEAVKNLPADLVAPLANLQPAGKISGQFQLVGNVSEPKKLLQSGQLRFANVSVLTGGERPLLTGVLKIAGDSLASENLQAQMGENSAAIDLQANNLLGEIIHVRSNLRSERFALDPLLKKSAAPVAATAPLPATKKEPAEKNPFPLALPVMAEGTVTIGETLYKGLSVRDFDLRYRLQNNVLTIQRLNGKVANGTFAIFGNADLGRQAPVLASRIVVQGIQAEPLLQAFYPRLAGTVFGTLNLQTQLAGTGSTATALKKTITGEGTLQLSDGRITGAPLLQGLADFLSLPELRELRFNRSEGSFTIQQGDLSVNSSINGRNLRLQPRGTVNLDSFALDLALNLRLAPELVGRMGKGRLTTLLADEQGWSQVPVRVAGTLTSPRFTLDSAALGEKVREKTEEEVRRKLRKELERRFPSGNGKTGDDAGRSGAEEILRGLFGR